MALPSYQKSKDGIEVQFAVNYLGHFLFINLLVDKLLAGDATVVTYTRWVDKNGNLNSAIKVKTLAEGAATGIIAAFDRRISNEQGYFLADGALTERGLLPAAVDPTIAAKLWSISEKLIK
ncbi:hypothetical protein NW755_010595 [Fusarium falciforme]|uniref:Uncharacterized protein n=1 Tax=Fusarium falciforme TaxID=195108 RepID=A0A9W8R1P5_9HYPO|nr:hypothetical protein NW755_010595 [Fusarium falciforme]KAJ4245574.1 hypothetical protein NW757_009835 [Fusarium falciforme]